MLEQHSALARMMPQVNVFTLVTAADKTLLSLVSLPFKFRMTLVDESVATSSSDWIDHMQLIKLNDLTVLASYCFGRHDKRKITALPGGRKVSFLTKPNEQPRLPAASGSCRLLYMGQLGPARAMVMKRTPSMM